MADQPGPATGADTPLTEAANHASTSSVGPRDGEAPETLPGTDTMGSETGGLAGTSR